VKKFIEKLPLIVSISTGILLLLFFIVSIFASELTLEETKNMLDGDLYKIAEWMGKNIKTTHESLGYGQMPKRTFKYRKGDCEDWALLSQYFIGDKYETYTIIWCGQFREDSKYYAQYKNKKISHGVLAIKLTPNNWGIIDQDRYISNGNSLSDIVKINCNLRKVNVKEAFIMDLRKFRRKVIKEINLGE